MTERRPPRPRAAGNRPDPARRPPARAEGAAKRRAPAAGATKQRTATTTKPRTKPASKPPKGRRNLLWRWRRGLFLTGLVSVAMLGGVTSIVFNISLPPEETLLQTSFVCAGDVTEACGPDNAIATFSAEEDRINVPLEELPDDLVNAVLATEDRDFFQHGGIDPVGIARALYQDLRGGAAQQGGSTITQQYVKNAYLTSERSLTRKVKEAVLAVKLERELEKDEILERYLNTIYFGRGAYGVGAASRAYFGKDVRSIGVPEASYLAGLIRSPGSADAQDYPEEAARRRGTVLGAMREEGYLTAEIEAQVDAMPFDYVIPKRDRRRLQLRDDWQGIGAEYFIESVRIQVAERYGEDTLYGGGLRIYTTIDHGMQAAAWDAVTSTLDEEGDPEAALVALDEYGQVKAMIGGRDIQTDSTNLALGNRGGGTGRQAGSSFKPIVLAEAIQQGISLNTMFESPGRLVIPKANAGADWNVRNYAGTEQGVLDLVDATRVSSNTAYAQLMLEVGPEAVVDMAKQLGVASEVQPNPSLVLGTSDVSPLDMATAFSTFANRGVRNDPTQIAKIEQVDDDGTGVRVLEQLTPSAARVLTEQEADLVTYCLEQVVDAGTGKAADIGRPVAGKTGTTQDNKDAWFVGYTPKLTAAVWMGYADLVPGPDGVAGTDDDVLPVMDDVHGREVTGGSFPAEIWAKFMRSATRELDTGDFVTPTQFPGRVLNPELEVTTTTAAPSTTAPTTTTTTAPAATTTTTAPATTTTVPPTTVSTAPAEPGPP